MDRWGSGVRIVICDDEAGYRQILHEKILKDCIANDYEAEIVEFEDGEKLLSSETAQLADVYFLDIQMEQGGDDGIRVARDLRRRGEKGLIVYVTGFIDYVQTGYEVKAFRYLLKNQIQDKLPQVLTDIRKELFGAEVFAFQCGRETVRVNQRSILYLESDKRQLQLMTQESEYRFYGTLEEVHKELGEQFLRCHRSFLVNMEWIETYTSDSLRLKGGIMLPVSRSYSKEIKKRLMLNMI